MNYFGPRQRKDGRWDYTCMNDGVVWPVGYCAEYREWWNDLERMGMGSIVREDEKSLAESTAPKHHTEGHATSGEACECYREYLLDHRLRFGKWSEEQHRCKVCNEWTQGYASVDNSGFWDLCDQHCNREEVEKLFEAPGEIWSS